MLITIVKWLPVIFGVLYLLALLLFLIGSLGLFGTESGPLAGIFLVPLGLPWNLLVDRAPEKLWPWLSAAAPALNLAILIAASRVIASWGGK